MANQKRSNIGIILVSLKKITMENSLRLGVPTTNNEARYSPIGPNDYGKKNLEARPRRFSLKTDCRASERLF